MELPKFTAPVSMTPNLSLTDSIKNVSSQVGSIASSNIGGATSALGGLGGGLGGATSALGGLGGGLGGATSALGDGITSAKDGMEKLTGPARAKFMASLPELPEQGKGLSGIMEKGVDLGKFQEKSVGNLMSKVSDFSPGKSILSLGKESGLVSGLKDKLSSLKPAGSLGNVLGGAIGGAGVGAVIGAATGGGKNILANAAKGAGIGAIAGGVTGAISSAAGGITGKIGSALGGGSVGNTIASGITGAVGGAALGKIVGGQSVNLKGIAGNLAGSVAGGIGAKIGSNIVGSNIPGITGIGAAAGGAISGIVGGSAGKKALTGLAAGVGISAVSGLLSNMVNQPASSGASNAQQTVTSEVATTQQDSVSQPSTPIPDLSKNSIKEIQELADKSPQSVPPPQPIASPETAISAPNQKAEEMYLATGVPPTNAIEEARQLDARYKANQITGEYISTDILSRKLFMLEMNTFIQKKYSGFFKARDSTEMRALMEKDIAKVSSADKALVKDVIANYKGTFSMAYSGATDKVMSDPENRTLSLNDYLAMDTEDFFKFLTNVAEGQFEVKALSPSLESTKPPYKVFISKKSDSEVNITISNPAYGTGTATIPRATPPSMDVLFNMKAIKECVSVYHFGKIYPNIVASEGTMDALNPKDGAYFRMWAMTSDDGKTGKMRYCCGNNIIIDQQSSEETYVTPNEKKYNVRDLKDTPPEVSWDLPGWVAKVKIAKDLYYTVSYNPYTIQVNSIQVVKMVPKT